MELKKISENEWEIPKTGGMRVPARIFASEKLVKKIREDRTIQQAANVAWLKGIQKYAYVMPDAHEGYGFPIGGVAAFDTEEGVISPGGIGYDINCITGEAKILTELGYHIPIKDFENTFNEQTAQSEQLLLKTLSTQKIVSLNLNGKTVESQQLEFFIKKSMQKVFLVETQSGFALKSTLEHPYLTRKGMKMLMDLKPEDEVAVNLFSGVEYDEPGNRVIVSSIEEPASSKELKTRNLLPLRENSPKLPHITKILGYLMGDGVVYFANGKGQLHAYGVREDLELMKNDLQTIGYSSQIYSRKRTHTIHTQYDVKTFDAVCCELHCSSTSLAKLFVKLGMPLGKKTSTAYTVPSWITNAPKWVKRLFLAGFFGAELSTPATHSKTGFYSPVLSQNKIKSYLESGREFLIGIMQLLDEFGIKSTKISQCSEHVNMQGDTYRLRLLISADENNLLKLFQKIGFEYNSKRSKYAGIAALYILKKKKLTEYRIGVAKKVSELKKKGLTAKEIKKLCVTRFSNEQFIERCLYEKTGVRITLDFFSFEEFAKKGEESIEKYGVLFDTITEVRELAQLEDVYDFTVSENHNFVANGFFVSNCGVRLLRTDWNAEEIAPKLKPLLNELFNQIPSGVGRGGQTKLSKDQMMELLAKGSKWSLEQGYGKKADLDASEEYGWLKNAEPNFVSDSAIARGRPQLGTLGAGNHFLEIQKVDEIYDEKTAKAFGIEKKGQVTVMVHCGSRGFGHQVASDYIKAMEKKYGFENLPDRELVNAPFASELGQKYFKAMLAGMNYAFANRQMIVHWMRDSFRKVMGTDDGMKQVYDVCHNIAKVEKHNVDGEMKELCVHRKGATRSFGPGREEVNEMYKKTGQPIFIPGSMATASYILVGTKTAEEKSFGSTAHGAGREMSRADAIRQFRGETVAREMEKMNILVKAASWKGIAEEAAPAYKDIDEVIKVSNDVGLGKAVARLVPLGVVKG